MTKAELLELAAEDLAGTADFQKLRKFRDFFFSPRSSKEGLAALKELGVQKVIDLKTPQENEGFTDKENAVSLGLEYHNVPVASCSTLSKDRVRELNEILEVHEGKKALIYCASGNRAGAWLAAHLFFDHNFSIEEAISKAKQAGVDKEALIADMRAHLAEQS